MSHRVENIVKKGEIACYEQFLLFSQCLPHLHVFSASKLCGNGLKHLLKVIDPRLARQFRTWSIFIFHLDTVGCYKKTDFMDP